MPHPSRRDVAAAAAAFALPVPARGSPRSADFAELAPAIARHVDGLAADPLGSLAGVQAQLRAAAGAGAFDPWLRSVGAEDAKLTLFGEGRAGRRWKVQLFFVPDGRSHPPHCHENLASCLLVVDGRLRLREYERLRDRETDHAAVLEPVFDGELAAGEGMLTSEGHRNAHWFGAVGGPALAVNFKASGHFRRELLRLRNRRYVDASQGGPGVFAAPFLSSSEAKARFAARRL